LPSVEILDIFESFHEVHFSLGVVGSIFEVLHGIFFLLIDFESSEVLFSLLRILDGFVVASSSCFYDVVMVFGVSFECDFGVAVCTFEIEPKDFDAQIGLFVTDLHSHVELGPDVEVVLTGIAS
jgi:hypothetical protein